MQIRLSRTRFFITSVVVVFIFVIINRVTYISQSKFTRAVVVDHYCWGLRNSYCNPVLEFETENAKIQFQGETDLDAKQGDTLTILYKQKSPQDAAIWSFGGFWLISFLYAIFTILLLNAIVFSFIKARSIILIDFYFHKNKIMTKSIKKLRQKNDK